MGQVGVPPLPVLDDYRIAKRYGSRPSGSSLLMQHVRSRSYVFAKVLPWDSLDESATREWLLLSNVSSPGIPPLLGAGRHEEHFMILRQHVEGISLEDLLASGAVFSPERELSMAANVARTLAHVHAAGLHHGRLKPSNVILGPDDRPILTELHVPYLRFTDLSVARTGFRVESPAYLSPEHFDPHQSVDIRSDIFCLGVILYRMASGVHPFPGDTVAEIKDQVLHFRPPRASESFSNVIARMMDKDPGKRYQTPDELLSDIEALRKGGTVAANPLTEEPILIEVQKAKPGLDPLIVKLLLVLCGLTVLTVAAFGVNLVLSRDPSSKPLVRLPAPQSRATSMPRSEGEPVSAQASSQGSTAEKDPAAKALDEAVAISGSNPTKAVEALDRIIRDYPDSPAAVQALQHKTALAVALAQSLAKQKGDLDAAVKDLIGKDQFGAAIALYTRFAQANAGNQNVAEQAQLAEISLKSQAEKRYASIKSQAGKLIAAKKPDDAAQLYELVRDNFGIEQHVAAAKKQLTILEPLASTDRAKRIAEQRKLQRKAFLEKILPAERMARTWRFSQAARECDRLAKESQDQAIVDQIKLQEREYELLAGLKARMIEAVGKANPPIALAALNIGRDAGTLSAAGEEGVTMAASGGQAREKWELTRPAMIEALAAIVQRKDNADDHLARALLLQRVGRKEAALREFDRAEKLGAADAAALRPSSSVDAVNVDTNEKAAEELIERIQTEMNEGRWAQALSDAEKLKETYGPGTYIVQARSVEVDEWVAACRAGVKERTFEQGLKQGTAIDLLGDTVEKQWQITGGKWELADKNVLRCENLDKRDVERLLAADCPPQYLLRVKFRVVSGAGLLVRVASVGNVACDYMVDVNTPASVGLWLSQAGKVTRTVVKEMRFERNKWYEVTAAVRPNAITVRCGDTRVSVTNSFPSASSARTSLGFIVRQESTAEFSSAILQVLKRQ